MASLTVFMEVTVGALPPLLPTPRLESPFDALYVDSQARATGQPREQVERDYFNRPDKADNQLAPVKTQLAWLLEVGFGHVDCYFKWLELAHFGSVKAQ
jgi:hypothetical protein